MKEVNLIRNAFFVTTVFFPSIPYFTGVRTCRTRSPDPWHDTWSEEWKWTWTVENWVVDADWNPDFVEKAVRNIDIDIYYINPTWLYLYITKATYLPQADTFLLTLSFPFKLNFFLQAVRISSFKQFWVFNT